MSRIVTCLLLWAACATAAPTYYWHTLAVGQPKSAELVTLFCSGCGTGGEAGHDIPLVAVLRDTLGESDVASHKLTAVWLLSYSHPTISQRALAAIPFFYWNVGDGSAHVKRKDTTPLLDLSAPRHPAAANVERQILQWTTLDAAGTPVRASSRAYRTNEVDHERLHLEEANSYLLKAPVGDGPDELTESERDLVMARLELRKKLLGGFVSSALVGSLGKEASFEQERVRTRNWELLRQCAEKTGLVFEPVKLAGGDDRYAMLWYPERALLEPGTSDLGPIWKLLSIKDPYSDDRLPHWTGLEKTWVSSDGKATRLIPLGLYSLTYPRQPLLLIDFRDKRSLRRRDITQKSIDEITSGIVGLSHFTNWYYFVASDAFSFVQQRRGKANNRAERLDSYSEFRVALALDHDLEPALHKELERRSGAVVSNPLESSPASEMTAALSRYSLLEVEAAGDDSRLIRRIDSQRREELATFGATPTRQGMDLALHTLTLGKYTHRAKRDEGNMFLLATYRRAGYNIAFLDKLVAAGTPPEVPYPAERVQASVTELSGLMPYIKWPDVRAHVQLTLQSLGKISSDETLRAACDRESVLLKANQGNGKDLSPGAVPGILTVPAVSQEH